MKKILALLAGLLALAPLTLMAENSTHAGGYTIHHNVLTTDLLEPRIAKAYQLTRSSNRGMLNVSVIKDVPGTTGTPVTAKVKAKATNLLGQAREIPLREIREGNAVYYIGDFLVSNNEALNFELDVTPEGSEDAYKARLSHQFVTE